MIISEISIKNYKSYGNSTQTLKLNTKKGELILLSAGNGFGKSVIPSTEIDLEVDIENFDIKDLISFLRVMGEGRKYIEYIKEKNPVLYEQYISEQKSIE